MMSCLIILSKCQDLGLFWGFVQMHSGRHVVNIDLQSLGLKSDRNEGGILGLKFKIQIFTFSQHKQFISTQTMLIHRNKIYTYVSIPYPPCPRKNKNRSQYERDAARLCPFYIAARIRVKGRWMHPCKSCTHHPPHLKPSLRPPPPFPALASLSRFFHSCTLGLFKFYGCGVGKDWRGDVAEYGCDDVDNGG
jgi:hypothetical protein